MTASNSTNETAVVYTDGAARGNPGPAGAGVYFVYQDEEKTFHKYLGEATNNQAEYEALILALEKAKDLGITRLQAYADSELMVRQINGQYKVKNPQLKVLFDQAKSLSKSLSWFRIEHVRREQNKDADLQANLAIDEAT